MFQPSKKALDAKNKETWFQATVPGKTAASEVTEG